MVEDNRYKYCNITIDFVIHRSNYKQYEKIVNDFVNEIEILGDEAKDNMNVSEFWTNYYNYSEVQQEELLEEIPF